MAQLKQMQQDAALFECFFLPMKIREHGDYIQQKTDKLTILQKHLRNEDSTPYFAEGEEELLKNRDFVERAYYELKMQSGVLNEDKKKANLIYQGMMLELEKRRLLREQKNEKTGSASHEK